MFEVEENFKFFKLEGTNLKAQANVEWKAKLAGWLA